MRYTPKQQAAPTKEQESWALRTLQAKAQALGRLPQKADFDDSTRARIKTFLGPWKKPD